jgi:putative flippase GtrA
MAEIWKERTRLPEFVLVSGVGWLIDFSIFSTLTSGGVTPFSANLISAGTAVLFVFAVCRRALFRNSPRPLHKAITLYVIYNIAAIAVASLFVQLLGRRIAPELNQILAFVLSKGYGSSLAHVALAPIVAKVVVTPLTLYANFVAMNYINLCRLRLL